MIYFAQKSFTLQHLFDLGAKRAAGALHYVPVQEGDLRNVAEGLSRLDDDSLSVGSILQNVLEEENNRVQTWWATEPHLLLAIC